MATILKVQNGYVVEINDASAFVVRSLEAAIDAALTAGVELDSIAVLS
jgi:hypothetical protein